jgi:hypothetical protein
VAALIALPAGCSGGGDDAAPPGGAQWPRADEKAYKSASAAVRADFDEKSDKIWQECEYEAFGRG